MKRGIAKAGVILSDPFLWGAANNPTSIDMGDGAGGITTKAIPYYGSEGRQPAVTTPYSVEQTIINFLQCAWVSTVGKGNGTAGTPVIGTGNGLVGSE